MSSRGLLKSMTIVGGAQAINIVIALVRVKVVALLLGPAGFGLLAAFNGLVSTVAGIAGLGLRNSGVRDLASAKGEPATLSGVRQVLFWAHFVQSVPAAVLVWVFREPLAVLILDDPAYALSVGLLGVAVVLSLMTSAQQALLQGLRRIGDLARVTVLGALASTAAGLLAVWLAGADGLVAFVIIQPLATLLVAATYVGRLPKPAAARMGPADLWRTWTQMARLGVVFMASDLLTTGTLLLVRTLIIRSEGLEAAGYFAAAWTLTMQYVGFMLTAMGADYYPRLAGVIHDRPAAVKLMNEQLQLGLAIAGPVLMAMIGLAPVAIWLLYSDDFAPAVPILEWQLFGNVFKLASWPLGFALVAAGRGRVYFLTQLFWNALFLTLVGMGLPLFGVFATGPAFALSYAALFAVQWQIAARTSGFVWEARPFRLFIAYAVAGAALLAAAAALPPVVAAVCGCPVAAVGGIAGLRLILATTGRDSRVARLLHGVFDNIGWKVEPHHG